PEGGEMLPGGAGDEQDRERDHAVDQCGAQIGLHEHDQRGHEPQQEQPRGALPRRLAPGPVDGEAGKSEDEQKLAQLRRLKLKERELDPAAGAESGDAEDEDEDDREDHRGVDADAELPEPRVVDPREREHQGDADDRVYALADRVVVGIAADLPLGGEPEGDDAADDQPDSRERGQRVDLEQAGAGTEAGTALVEGPWSGDSGHLDVSSSKQRSRSPGLAGARHALALDVEEDVEELTGGGGRGLGAEAAALDREDDDELRIVGGRQRRVPGLVLLVRLLGGTGPAGDMGPVAAQGRGPGAARRPR